MTTLEEMKSIMARNVWGVREVMLYTGYAKSKAYSLIKTIAKKPYGKSPLGDTLIYADALLEEYGTSRKKEMATYGEEKTDIREVNPKD